MQPWENLGIHSMLISLAREKELLLIFLLALGLFDNPSVLLGRSSLAFQGCFPLKLLWRSFCCRHSLF